MQYLGIMHRKTSAALSCLAPTEIWTDIRWQEESLLTWKTFDPDYDFIKGTEYPLI